MYSILEFKGSLFAVGGVRDHSATYRLILKKLTLIRHSDLQTWRSRMYLRLAPIPRVSEYPILQVVSSPPSSRFLIIQKHYSFHQNQTRCRYSFWRQLQNLLFEFGNRYLRIQMASKNCYPLYSNFNFEQLIVPSVLMFNFKLEGEEVDVYQVQTYF